MTNASRAQIDLEALARDLRHEDGAGRAASKADPLAELAKIVGQDDPFRALLAARNTTRPAHEDTASQGQGDAAEQAWQLRSDTRFPQDETPRQTPADAFDQYLASVERDMHAYPDEQPADGAALPEQDESYDDARSLRRAAPRRRFASVGAGLAVVAVAVTGALTYKGLHGGKAGGVPIVQADTTPLKVAPKVADGVEIPDQNRQIYERNAASKESGQIKVVNREEQPLDVAEAARAAGGTPSAQGTTPGSGPFDAFGEPRKVRTVSVKPEAPPAPPPQAEPAPSPVPTMVLPGTDTAATPEPAVAAAPAPVAAPNAAKPAKPVRQADASPVPSALPVAAEPVAKPVPAAKKAPQRIASVAPDALTAASPETTQATSAPLDTTSPVSGFSVQLGVRNSASDAHTAFRQLQAKYSLLAGKPELIRQAEVNGKTLFRVRVGPLSKEAASSLCTSLQGEGGQCYVARN